MPAISSFIDSYVNQIPSLFTEEIKTKITTLAHDLFSAWIEGRNVFICGNGGSAANALHISNDLFYGIGACGKPPHKAGINIEALSSNSAILTCLANDEGYESIFSQQLITKARKNDLLIVLSGSGNSVNIINAVTAAKEMGVKSYGIVAFDGGKVKDLCDVTLHFHVKDMQIAEDTQLLVGHMCMQWLNFNKHKNKLS